MAYPAEGFRGKQTENVRVRKLAMPLIRHVVAWVRKRYPTHGHPSPPRAARRADLKDTRGTELALPCINFSVKESDPRRKQQSWLWMVWMWVSCLRA